MKRYDKWRLVQFVILQALLLWTINHRLHWSFMARMSTLIFFDTFFFLWVGPIERDDDDNDD